MSGKQLVYLTQQGFNKLRGELHYLETVKWAEVAARVRAAREEGGINENAAYDDASRELGFVEGRIVTLRATLYNALIIEDAEHSDKVRLGSRVTVVENGSNEPEVYHIVGSAEADPFNGCVSNESPIGRALLGQKAGAVVSYPAPDGEVRLTIISIG
jgi:transcription elongation factor GreA